MSPVRLATLLVSVVVGISLPQPSSAQVVLAGGGKNAQVLVENLVYNSVGFASTTMTIPKGQSRNLLVVQVNGSSTGPGVCSGLFIGLSVNEISLFENNVMGNPGLFGVSATSLGVGDLDQLESANPGVFKGKPLSITINVNNRPGDSCGGATITAIAQMIPK